MYKIKKRTRTTLEVNESVEGETIETKMERLLNNNDETTEGKELIFTRKEDGIVSAFNIRHDHWDEAIENTTLMAEKHKELDGARLKKREELLKKKAEEDKFIRDNAKKGMENQGNEENPQV